MRKWVYEQLVKLHNAVTFQMLHHVITFENLYTMLLHCFVISQYNIITMLYIYVCNVLEKMTHRW